MRQPKFWYRPPGLASWLLAPLGALYGAAVVHRLRTGPRRRADIPVICVGNLNVGGSGKTPAALAIAERLLKSGHFPHFVSRGYGGSEPGPKRVDLRVHKAEEVGDEPLLLAALAPTWVARDRAAAVREAAQAGATAAILDDGHQNASLTHDVSIVAVDAFRGFGNGRILPAGPLREPVKSGLGRADLILLIGSVSDRERFRNRWEKQLMVPVASAQTDAVVSGAEWNGMRAVAFAGIASPEKFFKTLKELGTDVVREVPLSDHAPLSGRLLRRLAAAAASENATLVTTEKDAVRLPQQWRTRVLSLPVRLQIESWDVIDSILMQNLPHGGRIPE